MSEDKPWWHGWRFWTCVCSAQDTTKDGSEPEQCWSCGQWMVEWWPWDVRAGLTGLARVDNIPSAAVGPRGE